jgi:hypothetical protein
VAGFELDEGQAPEPAELELGVEPPAASCALAAHVIILVFVIVMTALGYTPEAAIGVAARALAAAARQPANPRRAERELPGGQS